MASPAFHFKKFTIRHDKCAMKVGTDGVLLGAWVAGHTARHVLDVGTGSGVIAVMLAQRFPQIRIMGLELDPSAAAQASENMKGSPWANRLQAKQAHFLKWATETHFDLIVSNPPYFENALKSGVENRDMARHTTDLTVNALLDRSAGLLHKNGRLGMVLPAAYKKQIPHWESKGWYVEKCCEVYPAPGKAAKRILLSLVRYPTRTVPGSLLIEEGPRQYTNAYKKLTGAFYLHF